MELCRFLAPDACPNLPSLCWFGAPAEAHLGQILKFPVIATTQNRARLGETCAELGLDVPGGIQTKVHADKTLFSMITPEVRAALTQKHECIIVGIESHICVTQTALELLREGHKVYVLADGVSSCNKEEIPIALARLRHEGVVVTTSESFLYELINDAAIPEYVVIHLITGSQIDCSSKVSQVQGNGEVGQGDEGKYESGAADPVQGLRSGSSKYLNRRPENVRSKPNLHSRIRVRR